MTAKCTVCLLLLGMGFLCTSAAAGTVVLTAQDGKIECGAFSSAQTRLAELFQSVQAEDETGKDVTESVRVTRIAWADSRGRYHYLDLVATARDSGHFKTGEYDYTLSKTQKLFQTYFIFKPGGYEISYEVLNEKGQVIDSFTATATQLILVGDSCGGTLGCLSCDALSGCRDSHIPASVSTLKGLIGDWLLIALSVMVLAAWTRPRPPQSL